MKKKILYYSKFTCAFVGLYLLSSLGASGAVQGRIVTISCPPQSNDTRYEQNAVSYPLMFLKGSKNIEADPKKGFNLLQDIYQLDRAKLWVAYCYEVGLGTEKDSAKAQEIINEIKEIQNISYNISNFLAKEDIVFGVKLADFCFAKTNKFKESYQSLIRDTNFRNIYADRYEAMIQEISKDPKENVELLIDIYSNPNTRDYDKFIDLIDYIEEDRVRNFSYTICDRFFYLVNDKQAELVEKLLKTKNFYLALGNQRAEAMIYLAFCKMYGYGTEVDEAEANRFIDNYIALSSTNRTTYHLLRLGQSGLENADKFIYDIANKLSDNGDSELLSTCLKEGIGCERDRVKSFMIDFKRAKEKNFPSSLRRSILINFQNAYRDGTATPEMEKMTFEIIDNCLDDEDIIFIHDVILYYNFTTLGYGDESTKAKAFKKTEEFSKKNDNLYAIEALAYFYENGIGCEKDEAKAKELRLEIDNIINEKPARDKWSSYCNISNLYTSNKKELRKIYSPEMLEFYKKKGDEYRYEREIGNMPAEDIALMMEFREITKLFKDENGKPVKAKAKLNIAKKKAGEFFQKVLDAKSLAMYEIAQISFGFDKVEDLDTLQLRVTGLPYFEKAADDYCPKLYSSLATAYEIGRGTRGDDKIAADYYFKAGTLEEEIPMLPKADAFKKALDMYIKIGDYALAKKSLDEWEKISEPSLYLDRTKARFYLYESDYKDVDYAKVLIAKIKESLTDADSLRSIVWNAKANAKTESSLEFKELRFWASTKLYDLGAKLGSSENEFVYRQLIFGYQKGIYCEKDIEKSVELLKEYYTKVGTDYIYDAFVVEYLSVFLRDIEDKDPTLLRSTIESLMEINADSASLNLMKAIAIDEEFGYEKDIALRDSCLEKATKRSRLLWTLTKHYNLLAPSSDLLATFTNLIPEESKNSYDLYSAYCRLGNIEEAQKYGKMQETTSNIITYNSADVACLILKSESDEDLAKRFSKSKLRGSQAIYASMLYQGKGVSQDKAKAVEIFEKLDKLWNAGEEAGDNSRLWLWKHYTESNQQDKAQALIDPKTQGTSLYNSAWLAVSAKIFMDCLDIDYIRYTSNMPRNEEYAKYFLELMEEKYPSQYADTLIELYGTNPNFQNLEKKKEIRAKAKAMLNTPPARAKEEVDYPDKKKIIKKIKI